MEKKNQSSIDWLVENMELNILWTDKAKEIFEKAKEMRQKELKESYDKGYANGQWDAFTK